MTKQELLEFRQVAKQKLLEKWEPTKLLTGLSEEQKNTIVGLLENTAKSMACSMRLEEAVYKKFVNMAFPIVRRVFGNNELRFTFEATTLPAFLTLLNDESFARTAQKYSYGVDNMNEVIKFMDDLQTYSRLDAEIEMSQILEQKIVEKINRDYANKHIIFYTPLDLTADGELCFRGYVCEPGETLLPEERW